MAQGDDDDSKRDLKRATDFLLTKGDKHIEKEICRFGAARFPVDSQEANQCQAIVDILNDYGQRKDPARPLSIAVFGPPRSGKSFTVAQLVERVTGIDGLKKINLSQLSNSKQLADWLSPFAGQKKELTPCFFFDEFDATVEGNELGWLSWFLAPMWDGEFVHDGKSHSLKRAVFIFAGGTAERFEDFERCHAACFGHRKGPDFVSRLAGFLDIEGVNTHGPTRYLRRALVLQHLLAKRSKRLALKGGRRNIDRDVLGRLLAGGHYIHGTRSMELLLDMSTLGDSDQFTSRHLPSEELMRMHVSRGPFDGMTVGISSGQEDASQPFLGRMATSLIERGAILAYAGNTYEGATLTSLISAVEKFPEELIKRKEKRIRNLLAYPSYLKKKTDAQNFSSHVDFEKLRSISTEERPNHIKAKQYFAAWSKSEPYQPEEHFAWSLSLFRMRLRLLQEVNALIVIGGKGGETTEPAMGVADRPRSMPWGRFPGVAEEVMLALALKVPVYLLGFSAGAAEAVGHLMGLSTIHSNPQNWLPEPIDRDFRRFAEFLATKSYNFEVPHIAGLPQTYHELREYFRASGPGTDRWCENGLSVSENRELFNLKMDQKLKLSEQVINEKCVELVLRGISRLNSGSRLLESVISE